MTETARTAAFAAAAVLVGGPRGVPHSPSGPATTAAGFEQVGTPFYADFGALDEVGRFAVTAFDEATGEIRDFKVTKDPATGVYGIAPYDYPAEAAEKLGETAAALANVKRAALKSRRPADWADLGVVDPASEDVGELEGRGLRVALTGTDGNVLADLIIGNPVEGRDGFYYVRAPRDDSTYIAEVDLDLSAKFADWVDPKVLGVDAGDLRRIVDAGRARLRHRGPPDPRRRPAGADSGTKSFGQWSAEGLAEGKQVTQSAANELARTAAGLTIVGVRPKPDGLNPDLTVDPAVVKSQLQFDLIAQNVAGKGFSIVGTDDGGAQVVGGAGQLTVAAEDGVTFDLDFGELFTGTEYDVAVGDFGDRPATVGDGTAMKPRTKPRTTRRRFAEAATCSSPPGWTSRCWATRRPPRPRPPTRGNRPRTKRKTGPTPRRRSKSSSGKPASTRRRRRSTMRTSKPPGSGWRTSTRGSGTGTTSSTPRTWRTSRSPATR